MVTLTSTIFTYNKASEIILKKTVRQSQETVRQMSENYENFMQGIYDKINYITKFLLCCRTVYPEGAEKYSLGLTKFQALAKEAKAVYKIDKVALVNCEIFEKYLETFREY